jgi:hypothetical protein
MRHRRWQVGECRGGFDEQLRAVGRHRGNAGERSEQLVERGFLTVGDDYAFVRSDTAVACAGCGLIAVSACRNAFLRCGVSKAARAN